MFEPAKKFICNIKYVKMYNVSSHMPWLSFQKKQELMRQLLAHIVSKFEENLQAMVAATEENIQLAYAESITKSMAFGR